jgi:hypothetical protein
LTLAKSVITKASEWVPDPVMVIETTYPMVFENHGWRRTSITEVNTERLIHSHEKEITTLPEYENCVRSHFDAGVFNQLVRLTDRKRRRRYEKQLRDYEAIWSQMESHPSRQPINPAKEPTGLNHIRWFVDYQMMQALTDVLSTCGAGPRSDEQLLEVYNRHLESWQSPFEKRLLVAPLVNFTRDGEDIQLGNGLELCRLTDSAKMDLCNRGSSKDPWGYMSIGTLATTDWCLRCVASIPHLETPGPGRMTSPRLRKIEEDITDFITALRLSKSGDVGTPVIYDFPFHGYVGNGILSAHPLELCQAQIPAPPYETDAEFDNALSLFKALSSEVVRARVKPIRVALRIFNRCYARENWADRFVDCSTALENLFQPSAPTGDNIARRGAALLAEIYPIEAIRELLASVY